MPHSQRLDVFSDLPDEARLWVIPLDREIPDDFAAGIERGLSNFAQGWVSHGHPVPSAVALVENQIVVVAAHIDDTTNGGVSGCGIDSMFEAVEEATDAVGARQLDALSVLVRSADGQLIPLSRADIRRLAKTSDITPETAVVETTLRSLGELRTHGLLRSAGVTWVRTLLPRAVAAG